MQLFEFPPTRSIRVRWVLQELGADFAAIRVDLRAGDHRRPEFLKLNPAGKVPVLVDGDIVLTESVAICLYLADKFPEKGLLPSDLALRAQVHRWLFFAATELEQPLWRISRNGFLYAEADRQPGDIVNARRDFKEMAAVVDEHLRGREFLVGERVSIADFVMAYTLDWGGEAGLLADSPTLCAYVERMYARPQAAPRIAVALASIQS